MNINKYLSISSTNLGKFLLILIFLFIACYTSYKTISNINVAFIYNPGSTSLHPEYFVYHNTDTTSVLFMKINRTELLFKKENEQSKNIAKLKIHYQLINSFEDRQIIDSASVIYHIDKNNTRNNIVISILLKTKKQQKYSFEIIAKDLFKNKESKTFLTIDKSSVNTRQNYLLTNADNKPFFRNYFNSNELFVVHYNRKKPDSIFVLYYSKKFALPPPPFSITPIKPLNIEPDSIWIFAYNDSIGFQLKYKGMYHFQIDTSNSEGLTLFNFGENFPRLTTSEQLLKPLRYLNSSKQYRELEMYANKKIAVDNFWLEASGNISRAKELIRIYYNRAMFANIYFKSYTQGWKTDRGMLYIIFGAPSIVYKSDNTENWIYGSNLNLMSMNFTFTKVINPFSDNDYQLIRNEMYKTSWYQAADVWRNGRVFSVAK